MNHRSLGSLDDSPVSCEPLEARQFLAVTAAALAAEPAAPFVAKVNFQPAGAALPSGYLLDSGASYGARGNGFSYGWNVTNTKKTRNRNSSASPDQRYDTLNHLGATQRWAIGVPNGRYVVKLVAGDARHFDSYFRIDAEGERIIDFRPSSGTRWGQGAVTVDVADGALSLTSASGAINNKVCFVEIYQSDLPITVTVGPENAGGFTKSGPADFLLRPSGNMSGVTKVEFFNGSTKIGQDTAAPFGLYYKNLDVGSHSITTVVTSNTGAVTRSQPVPLTVKDPVVSWMIIGGSHTNVNTRQVGWNLQSAGWQGFVDTHIKPQLDWGVKRILLHNPFGTLPHEQMQLDQYLHAKASGLNWLTDGFARAWRPITDSGVEVIAYLGKLDGDPDFAGTNWHTRFWPSVAPAMDAGMSIALDAAVGAPAGSKTHQAAQMLRYHGIEVYVEARPHRGLTHWHDYNVICTDTFWDRSDPDRYADSARWAAPASMIKGEIIRGIASPPFGQTWSNLAWHAPYARNILQEGHSFALGVGGFMRLGISPDDLLA